MDEDRVEYPEEQFTPTDENISNLLRVLRADRQNVDGNDLELAGLGSTYSPGWARLLSEPSVLGWSEKYKNSHNAIFEVDYDKLMARLVELHGEERILRLMLALEEE